MNWAWRHWLHADFISLRGYKPSSLSAFKIEVYVGLATETDTTQELPYDSRHSIVQQEDNLLLLLSIESFHPKISSH